MINENDIKSLLPLTGAAFRILMALSDKILHGYGIMKESADEQGQQIPTGTLYRTITKLIEAGLIEECEQPEHIDSDDERRQYYKITGLGIMVVSAEAERYLWLANKAKEKQLVPNF
jgi:DNA-binding PadR family transcriptional regulator